jgi:hypothetical protein
MWDPLHTKLNNNYLQLILVMQALTQKNRDAADSLYVNKAVLSRQSLELEWLANN